MAGLTAQIPDFSATDVDDADADIADDLDHPRETSAAPAGRVAWVATCLAIVAVAALLRLGGMKSDFWLDEIWSLNLARSVAGPLEIFRLHLDNNHYLNTLWLWFMGEQANWEIYRIPSLVAGIVSVALMGWIASRGASKDAVGSRLEGMIALILGATCSMLVHYSSEARGYMPAVMWALACFAIMDRYLARDGEWGAAISFGFAAALGLLSHLNFVFPLGGFALWALVRLRRDRRPLKNAILEWLRWMMLPLIVLAILYRLDIQNMVIGGGETPGILQVLRQTVGFAFGWEHVRGDWVLIAMLAIALVIQCGLMLVREGDDHVIFYAACVVIVPGFILLSQRPTVVFPRYFLICVPFALLVFAKMLARLFEGNGTTRFVAVALILAFVGGHATRLARFYRDGRGGYAAAMRDIAQITPANGISPILIDGDHEFRNKTLVAFYREYLPQAAQISYVGHPSAERPRWYIVNDSTSHPKPAIVMQDSAGRTYRFFKAYPSSEVSGSTWLVYQHID